MVVLNVDAVSSGRRNTRDAFARVPLKHGCFRRRRHASGCIRRDRVRRRSGAGRRVRLRGTVLPGVVPAILIVACEVADEVVLVKVVCNGVCSLMSGRVPHSVKRVVLQLPCGVWTRWRMLGERRDIPDAVVSGRTWARYRGAGGSIIWGTWSFRALPIDFRLGAHFAETGQLKTLEKWGYSVSDWPISYAEMEPFYNIAETLLAVSGDREALNESVTSSAWYQEFQSLNHFKDDGNYEPSFPYPCRPYPITPVGDFVYQGFKAAGKHPAPLPSGMVAPGSASYSTREAIQTALSEWGDGQLPSFWQRSAEELWSDRVRDACNMCGFCGEFLCWGKRGPKSSSRVSTIRELQDLANAEIRTNAKVFEVMYDEGSKRATGIRYLDVTDPNRPSVREQRAKYVIVSCG